MTRAPDWTDDERAVLRLVFPEGGWRAVQAALPGRSEWGIRSQARELGLAGKAADGLWREDELEVLRRSETAAEALAQLPGRTLKAVEKKLSRLQVSEELGRGDIDALDRLVPDLSVKQLHRPAGAWAIPVDEVSHLARMASVFALGAAP